MQRGVEQRPLVVLLRAEAELLSVSTLYISPIGTQPKKLFLVLLRAEAELLSVSTLYIIGTQPKKLFLLQQHDPCQRKTPGSVWI